MQLYLNSSTGNIYLLSGLSCWKAEDVVTMVILVTDNAFPFNTAPQNITVSFTVTDFLMSKSLIFIFSIFSLVAALLPFFLCILIIRKTLTFHVLSEISEEDSSESPQTSAASTASATSPTEDSSGSGTQSGQQDSSPTGSNESSNRAVDSEYRNKQEAISTANSRTAFVVVISALQDSNVIQLHEMNPGGGACRLPVTAAIDEAIKQDDDKRCRTHSSCALKQLSRELSVHQTGK